MMTNLEIYKEKIVNDWHACKMKSVLDVIQDVANSHGASIHTADGDRVRKLLNWMCEQHKEPILDDAEKEYLKNVIKPFRNYSVSICKESALDDRECIGINFGKNQWYIELPPFKKDTMYKNMKIGKEYTLEELGL